MVRTGEKAGGLKPEHGRAREGLGKWDLGSGQTKTGKSCSTADELASEVRVDIVWVGRGISQVDPVCI